jgi:hypothetical protein
MDGADHAPATPSARSVPVSELIPVPKQLGSACDQGLETPPTVGDHAVPVLVANYWSFSTCLWLGVAIVHFRPRCPMPYQNKICL